MTRSRRWRIFTYAEVVPKRLRSKRPVQQCVNGSRAACAKGGFEIDMIFMAKAHIDTSLASEAHAIAARAEIIRHGRYQAQPCLKALYREIARWPSGAV